MVLTLIRFILFSFLISGAAGCSGSASSSGLSENKGSGRITAQLVWGNSSASKMTAKTLFAVPDGITTIKVLIYDANMSQLMVKDFPVTAGSTGSGTIDSIPAGSGYTVKFWGMATGTLYYEGIVGNVSIKAGETTNLNSVEMPPITRVSHAFGTYTSPQSVTLTASVTPATIYYTTNGSTPDTNSINGPSPLQNILIFGRTTIKFFSVDLTSRLTEPVKFGLYSTPLPP